MEFVTPPVIANVTDMTPEDPGTVKHLTRPVVDGTDGLWFGTSPYGDVSKAAISISRDWTNTPLPINLAQSGLASDSTGTSKLVNVCPTESILLFCNVLSRSFNLQTKAMRRALKAAPPTPQNASHVYQLRAEGIAGPLMYVRLQPSGMFTCPAVTTTTTIFKGNVRLYLEFAFVLPLSTPLPATPSGPRMIKYAQKAARESRKSGNINTCYQIHLWNNLRY
jgi:hypothetical protein